MLSTRSVLESCSYFIYLAFLLIHTLARILPSGLYRSPSRIRYRHRKPCSAFSDYSSSPVLKVCSLSSLRNMATLTVDSDHHHPLPHLRHNLVSVPSPDSIRLLDVSSCEPMTMSRYTNNTVSLNWTTSSFDSDT